jgi:PadR family transcriptional regulator
MSERMGGFEELVLLTVAGLGDEAYGVSVQQRLEEESGAAISIGAVYTVLDRLEAKGYVRSKIGPATPQRGGRRKRMFQVTAAGIEALREMRRLRAQLWSFLPHPRPV